MKKTILLVITLSAFISCKDDKKQEDKAEVTTETLAPVSDAMMENSVIYEANIRNYSPEGTFNAFAKENVSLFNSRWLTIDLSSSKMYSIGSSMVIILQ